jgi:hypothetical protein
MGVPPHLYTIDRIDNDKGYSKENCRWSTRKEQMNNTSWNRFVEYDGERLTMSQTARKYNVARSKLSWRIHQGWSIEDAIKLP